MDEDVLHWIDRLASFVDFGSNRVCKEFLDDGLELRACDLILDDGEHPPSDSSHLGSLCIAGLLDLVTSSVGKSYAEKAEQESISGSQLSDSFDGGLPLAEERGNLISCKLKSSKAGEALVSNHFLNAKSDFLMGESFFFFKLCKINFNNTSLDSL